MEKIDVGYVSLKCQPSPLPNPLWVRGRRRLTFQTMVMCALARVMLPPAQELPPSTPPPPTRLPIKSTGCHITGTLEFSSLVRAGKVLLVDLFYFFVPRSIYDFPKHPRQILNISVQIDYLATQLHYRRFLSRVLARY